MKVAVRSGCDEVVGQKEKGAGGGLKMSGEDVFELNAIGIGL